MKVDIIIDELVNWLRNYVAGAGAKGIVFGLSGGIDSAVMAGLGKLAFDENALGIIMPCHSNPEDEEHARLVAEKLDLKIEKVDLSNTYDSLLGSMSLENPSKLSKINLKPRLRMTTLYYYGQNLNLLVVGPTNLSEFTVGYFTKYGDSAVDIMPLASFVKEEIYELARALHIPSEIIDKKPSAGLAENQTDEGEMGFSYEVLDSYIRENKKTEHSEKIDRMYKNSQNKRESPPIFVAKNI